MTIGIYELFFNNKAFYIGQSLNIENRYKHHLYLLKNNSHINWRIQNAFNRYGIPHLNILEECDITELDTKELFWINESDACLCGLNIASGPVGSLYGDAVSNSKYTNTLVEALFKDIVNTDTPLAQLDIKYNTNNLANSIACGMTHSWLKSKYPEEYSSMLSKLGTRRYDAKAQGIEYPKILSPQGIKYEVYNLNEFARTHSLNNCCLHRLLTFKAKKHKGWTLA